MGRITEAVVRCSSNLHQQLHHSFNLYYYTQGSRPVGPGGEGHVSSGLYLYALGCLTLPLGAATVLNRGMFAVGLDNAVKVRKTTLETSEENFKLHSKRVKKITNYTRKE